MDKAALRKKLLAERRGLTNKAALDNVIAEAVISSPFFREADTVLCYLSLPDEVATEEMIRAAWKSGKRVAVPYCDGDTMDFYCLDSFASLHKGAFGVREPHPCDCELLTDFTGSVCMVPGLAFLPDGTRLGYGKGYYDKFLKNYAFLSVGLCYNSFILEAMPTEEHDIPVDMVVTDQQIFGGYYGRI